MDNQNFLIGEFNPLCKALAKTKSGTWVGGGAWLGKEFLKSIND